VDAERVVEKGKASILPDLIGPFGEGKKVDHLLFKILNMILFLFFFLVALQIRTDVRSLRVSCFGFKYQPALTLFIV
jgi:hypothetical protein